MCYQDKGRVCSDIRTRLFISRDSYVPSCEMESKTSNSEVTTVFCTCITLC